MSAENKALVRRWIKEIWNKGNLAVADEIVATNYVNNDPAAPMPESGREGFKKHVTTYRTAFPDLKLSIDDIVSDGNKVTVRWTACGTHKGTLLGIQPTGKGITPTGISIVRLAGGKVQRRERAKTAPGVVLGGTSVTKFLRLPTIWISATYGLACLRGAPRFRIMGKSLGTNRPASAASCA